QKIENVRRKKAARRSSHSARQISKTHDGDATMDRYCSWNARRTIAPLLCGKVHDDRPGLERRNDFLRNQDGCAFPWNERRGHDHVDFGSLRAKERDLRLEERRAHLFGVAATAIALLFDFHVEVRGTEALDLFFGCGARIEGTDFGSKGARS